MFLSDARQPEVDICNIRQWIVAFIFGQVVYITARQLSITNLAVSRYIKRENAKLPIDMCHSKSKTPIAYLTNAPTPHIPSPLTAIP